MVIDRLRHFEYSCPQATHTGDQNCQIIHCRSSGIMQASNSAKPEEAPGTPSMRVHGTTTSLIFSTADGVASQAATPEFGLLHYQSADRQPEKR